MLLVFQDEDRSVNEPSVSSQVKVTEKTNNKGHVILRSGYLCVSRVFEDALREQSLAIFLLIKPVITNSSHKNKTP